MAELEQQVFPELIPYRRGELWGYANRQKEIVIEPRFQSANPFFGEVARVSQNDLHGVILKNGELLLPCQYEDIGDLDYSFCTPAGQVYTFKENKYGLVDPRGRVVVPCECDSLDEVDEKAHAAGFYGYLPEFDFPQGFPAEVRDKIEAVTPWENTVTSFQQNGLWGLIEQDGTVLLPPQFELIGRCYPHLDTTSFRQNGKTGLLNFKTGKIVLEAKYEDARSFSEGQAACMQNGLWGGVNEQGQWDFEPQFEDLGELRCGLSAAQKDGLFGFVNQSGETKIDFKFKYVMDFSEGKCATYDDQGAMQFIDEQGAVASDIMHILAGPHSNGSFHVFNGEKWGIVSANGEMKVPFRYDPPRAMGQVIGDFIEEKTAFKKGALLGVMTDNGVEITEAKYITLDPYKEGMSLVSVQDPNMTMGQTPEMIEMTGSISGVFLFGFLNDKGQEVVPPKYRLAKRFYEGLAYVEAVNGRVGYIDYNGTEYFED